MKETIPEIHYRSSRICRVLGNPTAYEILKILAHGPCKPAQLADILNLTVSTISNTLRSLSQLNLVYCEADIDGKKYMIRDSTIIKVLAQLESLVKHIK